MITNSFLPKRVLALDPETGEPGPRQVTTPWVNEDQLVELSIGGDIVTTTEDHPFWNATDRAWQRADQLDAGESVLTADGDLVVVEGIDWATRTGGMAYNLTVAELRTYLVVVGDDKVLVYHKCELSRAAVRSTARGMKAGLTRKNTRSTLPVSGTLGIGACLGRHKLFPGW